MLCLIHDAPVENTLFEDGDGANTFRVFNPSQAFLHLKFFLLLADETYLRSLNLMDKDIGSGCGARPNILRCLHFLLKLVAIGFGVKARPKSIGSGCQKSPSNFWNHKEKRQRPPPRCCTVPIALGTTA